jgi:hydroxypyruvate reductase/glycerate 2-kinase
MKQFTDSTAIASTSQLPDEEMSEPSAAPSLLRGHALSIWRAALSAVDPCVLLRDAATDPKLQIHEVLSQARRIIIVGGGKAAGAMSAALESLLPEHVDQMEGLVNVPSNCVQPLKKIQLHAGRPAGMNAPTLQGVEGSLRMLELVGSAGPRDVVLCLLSGGGSALLPAPPPGVTLEDERQLTQALHACGATINEMNTVRKHVSCIKGGQLARRFCGRLMMSLIISDVIGDPLDVIASGPTAPDPTTFADALAILERYSLISRLPSSIVEHLRRGAAAELPDTLKVLPGNIRNHIIGNNAWALAAASVEAERLGFGILNLGSFIAGETREVATAFAGILRSIKVRGQPLPPPACILSGGETTVTLAEDHGLGGRNQEFVLAGLVALGAERMQRTLILSAGTDGEDGPTDAAGALADENTWQTSRRAGLEPSNFLERHDAYHFFDATGDLIRTGLTQTNVMDVGVMLVY